MLTCVASKKRLGTGTQKKKDVNVFTDIFHVALRIHVIHILKAIARLLILWLSSGRFFRSTVGLGITPQHLGKSQLCMLQYLSISHNVTRQ